LRAVIFDFGGVFTTSPVENFAVFERANGLRARFLGEVIKKNHHANAFARFERGEIDLDAFDRDFAAETKEAGFEVRGRTLVSLLEVTLRPEMARAFERVKAAGFKTGCITNNMPANSGAGAVSGPHQKEVARLFSLFDHVIESSKAGVRKPEPRIYEMMCDALGVAPAECVFIDDLGVNLKPAAAMGMRTIKAPFGDVRPAIMQLSALVGVPL
jgi:putative hydrolase of the HAD superfamily